MKQISLTSGELMDIISLMKDSSIKAHEDELDYLAKYYYKIEQQFQELLEYVQETQIPENRVANLILAA